MSCVRGIIARFKGLSMHKKDDADYFSNLPTEILEMIFAYIRPKTLFEKVLPVCRRFYFVVNNKRWWNHRIQNHPCHTQLRDDERHEYSALRTLDAIWRDEDAWANWDQLKRHTTAPEKGSVDFVRLFRKSSSCFCITNTNEYLRNSCKDSTFKLSSLDNRSVNQGILYETAIGHSDRVCGIEMHGTDQFISGSYDQYLKLWSIDNSSIRKIAMHRTDRLIKDIAHANGVLVCSTGLSTISLHDAHNGLQEVNRHTYMFPGGGYKWPLSIVSKGTFLYVACTDELMTVDIRNLRVPVQHHIFDATFAPDDSIAIYMNWSDGLLQCCNHRGYVQEFEASTLKHRQSFSVFTEEEEEEEEERVEYPFVSTRGSIVAITRTVVKGFSLRPRHEHLGTFAQFPDKQRPTSIDALEGDVVVGCSSGSLITWTND